MASPDTTRRSGYLFVAAGVMMMVAAMLAKQVALLGPGALFLVLGAQKLRPPR
ncbi:hypothetical protein [Roseateles sp. BYS87W]|uniref:Uncharacterized protein n=1 Tax=Pelomonas baiyunensis TaxID=3299026 RepID=A0ABW7GZ96_9BURK